MLQASIDQLTRGQILSRVFVLHWAQPKSRDIQYANKLITLPGRDEVGERDVPEYSNGSPIPGAVLISDEHGEDQDGNARMFFDALKAVHYFLGITPKKDAKGRVMNGNPKSPIFRAGLSVLPYPCTEDEIKATLVLSGERVEAFDYEQSLRAINEHDQKNAARSAHGQEPISGGKAYNDAVRFKRDYEAKQERKLGIVNAIASENPDAGEEELAFRAFMQLKLMTWAEKVPESTSEQRAKLIENWLNDNEVRAQLNRQYRISVRKKGYAENVGFKDTTETLPADSAFLADGAVVPR